MHSSYSFASSSLYWISTHLQNSLFEILPLRGDSRDSLYEFLVSCDSGLVKHQQLAHQKGKIHLVSDEGTSHDIPGAFIKLDATAMSPKRGGRLADEPGIR